MKTVKKMYKKTNRYGQNVVVYKEDNALVFEPTHAVSLAIEAAHSLCSPGGELVQLYPNTDFFVFSIGVKNLDNTYILSIFLVGKKACIEIKEHNNAGYNITSWMTPGFYEKHCGSGYSQDSSGCYI